MGSVGLTIHSVEFLFEGGDAGGINVDVDVDRLVI